MAKVKVYIPTYKRHILLKRAIESLKKQTFTDWVAEIHNDCVGDSFPTEYVNYLNDERISIINHPENLGAVSTFNLFFAQSIQESYKCILEDDNWLEPTFLEDFLRAMELNPQIKVAYSNHFLWQETKDNQWIKLERPKYEESENLYELIQFPDIQHIYSYHFSNCSLFLRNVDTQNYVIPETTRGDFMEHFRERAFPHPLLYVNKCLSNFSLTIDTYRKKSIEGYIEHEALLIASFFYCQKAENHLAHKLVSKMRQNFGLSINKILFAAIIDKRSRFLVKYVTFKEVVLFCLYLVRHPIHSIKVLKSKFLYQELWHFLIKNTKNRFSEMNYLGSKVNLS